MIIILTSNLNVLHNIFTSIVDGEFEVGGTCQSLVVYVNLGKKMFIGYTDQNTILEFLKGKEKGKTFKVIIILWFVSECFFL